MSTESMVSRPLHVFDVPEMINLKSSYIYNFFVADETINESGNEAVNGNLSSRFLRKGTIDSSNLNSRVPRYAVIKFDVKDTKKNLLSTKSSAIKSSRDEIEYALERNLIYTEEIAAGMGMDSLCFDNKGIPRNIENFVRMRLNSFGKDEAAPLEVLKELSEISAVDSDLLESMLPPSLKDEDDMSEAGKGFFNAISQQKTYAQLNTSYAPNMMRAAIDRGTSLSFPQAISRFLLAKDGMIPDKNSSVSHDEYIFDVPYLELERTNSDQFVAQADVVGYILEKKRVYKGVRYPMPPIIIEGNKKKVAFDSQIAYGMTYEYTGRTIAKFRVPATDLEGDTYIQTFLLASKPSETVSITVTEDRRPEPPNDFNFHFEYDKQNLILTWSPPTNPQRDVKYLQVFRRKTIHEPFQLIRYFDFDDSAVRTTPKEYIDPSVIRKSKVMPTFFIDTEFDKSSSYIYSLVALDARQISSRYSTQVKVSFDVKNNKIKKKFISYSGAPKQYPNWNLKQNFFVDSMKDSSHKQVHIYFNPEAYTLLKNGRETMPAFYATSQDPLAKYVFQFINTDRLLDQKLEIVIDDSAYTNTQMTQKTTFETDISDE